jgi:uncharacterized protein involved in outer membrane biogenesis
VVGPILLGALIVVVLATTPWGNERVRRLLVSQANDRITGALTVGHLRGNLFSHATLTDVRLVDSLRRPVFTAARVHVAYGLLAALRGRVDVRALEIDTALVVLDKRPGARWNFQALTRSSGPPRDTSVHRAPPAIANIVLRQVELR